MAGNRNRTEALTGEDDAMERVPGEGYEPEKINMDEHY